MLEEMTAEQFMRWEQYYEAEPWGESREDNRQAANTLVGLAPWQPATASLPDLHYPYFEDNSPEALAKRMRALDQSIKENKLAEKCPPQSQDSRFSSSPTPGD